MNTAQKKPAKKMDSCDLRFRLIDDGSDLFATLAALPSNAARNVRAAHLLYVGMLVESGRLFAGMQFIQSAPSANDPHVKVPTKPIKGSPKSIAAPVEDPAVEVVPAVQVHPDDLAEFFPK